MARTAIVNPRKRRRNKPARRYGRRRNPASSDRNYNPRRRRRNARRYGRKRNPAAAPASSVYSAGGYRRKPNPIGGDMFNLDRAIDTLPAATGGLWAARFAAKMAGPMEDDKPGFKHAIAMLIGASVGSSMMDSMFGHGKGDVAYIGALAFMGDLFGRKVFFDDSEWVKENLLLSGVDDTEDADEDPEWDEDMSGFENQSALGAGEIFQGPDGQLYQLSGPAPDAAMTPGGNFSGFENQSALGYARPSAESSFGYTG